MNKYAEMLRKQALREETLGCVFDSPGSAAHHNALAARYNECAAYLETIEAALRASTELLRQGAYRMVQAAPKEHYRTLDQIDANKAALGEK